MADLATIAYIVCTITVLLIGILAVLLGRFFARNKPQTVDFFLTARGSSPALLIAGSFYATACGAWVVFAMPSYVVTAGILGLLSYSISAGFPIILIAYVGPLLQKQYPYIVSLGDFVYWRFGSIMRFYVAALMTFAMGLALAAEYTAVGNLFEFVLGAKREVPVIIVAVVTSVYTAYGGLYVSILTDAVQAVMAITLLLIATLYITLTF
ncbi:hypothetical protein HK102_009245, partial [Quaeritorhiza haematococci]